MSIRVMSQVWESTTLDPFERLVLLSLADHADDEGHCYPSIARLCRRTGMKERGVQNVIRRLEEKGCLTIAPNKGKRGTNLYTVTPAPDAPPHSMHPAPDAPHPRTRCTPTPAPGAPEPSFNHQEPSGAHARVSAKAQTRGPLADDTAAILAEFLRRDGAKRRAWKEAAE
jgi:hypothetical protein